MTPNDAQGKTTSDAQRTVLRLWLTTALSGVTLGILSVIVWRLTPPLVIDAAFLANVTVEAGYFYADQPRKTMAFEFGCIAAPWVIALSYSFAGTRIEKLKSHVLPLALRFAVGATWLFLLACIVPLAYCPHPVLEGMPPSWLLSRWFFVGHHGTPVWMRAVCLTLVCAFGLVLAMRNFRRKDLNPTLLALLLLVAALVPSDFYTADQVNDDWRFTNHFNAIAHALSQVTSGHHLLTHFSHLYGGYVEFLGPLLALFPRRIETLLLPFGLLNALATLGFLLTARIVIRHPLLFLITGLGFVGYGYFGPGASGDCYYQYEPIRTLFPSWGLLAATLYFRRPSGFQYGLVSGLAALAPLWNFDTGIVLWAGWTTTLAAHQLGGRRPIQALKQIGRQAMLLVGIAIGFLFYLRLVSGVWPDPGLFFAYQKLVLKSGYLCVGVLFPDVWVIILAIYLLGLVTAFHFYRKQQASWKTDFLLMTSLLGIGLLLYFFGRSAESNLTGVAYPVILLLGVFLNEARLLISRQKLPQITWAFLLPLWAMICWEVVIFALALPELLGQGGRTLAAWNHRSETPFEINAAFVEKAVLPGEQVFMLSNQSGFYHFLSGTVCPINTPGPGELIDAPSMKLLIAGLNSGQFSKLVVDDNFYEVGTYRPDFYRRIHEAIATRYRSVATSATGQVTLYVPR